MSKLRQANDSAERTWWTAAARFSPWLGSYKPIGDVAAAAWGTSASAWARVAVPESMTAAVFATPMPSPSCRLALAKAVLDASNTEPAMIEFAVCLRLDGQAPLVFDSGPGT